MEQGIQLLLLNVVQITALLTVALFLFVMLRDPRTLWSGVCCFFALGGIAVFLVLTAFRYSEQLQSFPSLMFLLVVLVAVFALATFFFPFFADRQFLYRRNSYSVSGRAARPKHALVALCDFPDSVSHLLAANRELERKFCRASRLQCGGALDCLRAYPLCGFTRFHPF